MTLVIRLSPPVETQQRKKRQNGAVVFQNATARAWLPAGGVATFRHQGALTECAYGGGASGGSRAARGGADVEAEVRLAHGANLQPDVAAFVRRQLRASVVDHADVVSVPATSTRAGIGIEVSGRHTVSASNFKSIKVSTDDRMVDF